MKNNNPLLYYTKNQEKLIASANLLNKRRSALAWLRLFSFLAALAFLWVMASISWIWAIAGFLIFMGVFLFFVSKDTKNRNEIENNTKLLGVTINEISALQHEFLGFPNGDEWKPGNHPYANDLDIFGRASIYQYINRTTSEQGNQLLANWLLEPAVATEIRNRQDAARELSQQTEWRQQFQAYGIKNRITFKTEKNIANWLSEENNFIENIFWKVFRYLFPLLSFSVLGLYLAGAIEQNRFLPIILLFIVISYWVSKKVMPAYNKLSKITGELETLSDSIKWVENKNFNSSYLQENKKKFEAPSGNASFIIFSLKKILDRLDYRLNPVVHIPLNTFLCWDLQQALSLEKWKTTHKKNIGQWFISLANIEALSALGTLTFNHPEWCFPELQEGDGVFSTTGMGHPLIAKNKRVTSSFETNGLAQLALITGSNMAGKSTFLRSTGINIVLSMMGAPVCAEKFSVSHTRIISSMRVSDNLEESTSTFYAELKKLKEVIDTIYKKEKVFLLLDEILRGTNSTDRHIGSAALIRQLIKHNAIGMIATHDLELAKMAKEFPKNIHNYHFDVQVAGEELYFDYQLKKGICKSLNASILMKKIGIEL